MSSESLKTVQVTGWLLFLCLVLTFAYPASSLYSIFAYTIPRLVEVPRSAPAIVLLSIDSILVGALAVLSFIAGLKLWLVKPNAVRFARRYLLIYLLGNFSYFILWILITRPRQLATYAGMGWFHAAGPLAFFFLWYSYLEHSKRVRATYSSE